jgi:predicted nucleic acid-binding protein
MPVFFLDSSAVAKQYLVERGSRWILRRTVSPDHQFVIAAITRVEVNSALSRRHRQGDISDADLETIRARFHQDTGSLFRSIGLDDQLLDMAIELVVKYALRAYDAVQLATAIETEAACRAAGLSFSFVSADIALNAAARSAGLATVDPVESDPG